MAIPPFPSHDLAKLVLGYLAEEQLMTAYDEFLQASPYLDVLRNEYDRIFMTSLKSILAEYRAVKIYVETCKPFLLRKKIFQCSNLLEVVKVLVNHIDINKLHSQESSTDKSSNNKHTSYTKNHGCEVCNSLSFSACECRDRVKQGPMAQHCSQTDSSSPETSIEATSLADLPGNSSKRSTTKELATDIAHSSSNYSAQQILQSGSVQSISQSSSLNPISQRSSVEQNQQRHIVQQVYVTVKNPNVQNSGTVRQDITSEQNYASTAVTRQDISTVKSDEAKQKIDEFDNILKFVCSNNDSTNPPRRNNFVSENSSNRPIDSASAFQEFSTGVVGKVAKDSPILPDVSSTTEKINTQTTSIKENRRNVTPITNIRGPVVAQYFVRAGTIGPPIYYHTNQNYNSYIKVKEKPVEQKVTILSDVKVDNMFKNNSYVRMPQVLRSNTPNTRLQTLFINGTPAYTNKGRQTGTDYTYTRDEIMAMPTYIVVPSSGITQSSPATYIQSNISRNTNTVTTTTSAKACTLDSLVIDVTSNSPTPEKSSHLPEFNSEDHKTEASEGLVKTIDVTAASLPKDSNIAIPNKTSTPNVIPPTRKSSSTPRRNSHVRVLDFATPRRILHEAVNENDPNQLSTESNNDTEIIPNSSSDIPINTNILTSDKYDMVESNKKTKNTSTKENKSKQVNKNKWDAELRALALGTEPYEEPVLNRKPKLKKTKKKKKISPVTEHIPETPETDNTNTTHSTSHTTTKSNESLAVENVDGPTKEVTPINPAPEVTLNNVSECDKTANVLHTRDKSQIKVNTSDDRVDTPEAERISLHNVIGAKLNLSDLLETPYKQALYDIQMETPKFLGPDLPGEPISDIKIMSIPTPRFLNTPKPAQATPSSYASRPTDYSSGSSYYKPDDHDYIPSLDVLQSSGTVMVDTIKSTCKEIVQPVQCCTVQCSTVQCSTVQPDQPVQTVKSKAKEKSEKPSRPQRKCTKNVSYRSSNIYKSKDDESFEAASVSSETSNNSTKEKKYNKSIDSKARINSKTKHVSKKKVIVYKSPLKLKNFMKIKPRRSTPVQGSGSKERKKISDVTENSSSMPRKSKDKNTNITSIAGAAPTKSRRKSSTPRKLSCTKPFNPETLVKSPCVLPTRRQDVLKEIIVYNTQDSDTEQLALRWSDDGSQDAKPKDKEEQPTSSSLPDEDDIVKIKEYIETSAQPSLIPNKNSEGSLQIDLINRGFDAETAKIIERDLLDSTPIQDTSIQSTSNEEIIVKKIEVPLTVSDRVESESGTANNLQIIQDEDEVEEIELSVYECNEDSKNFVSCQFDESTFVPKDNISKLKDKFSMELCVDDDLTIRLRANPFTCVFDINPEEPVSVYNNKETEDAVSSICNIEKLYTPMKDTRAQCYEIFNSTLTSIDTPLKSDDAAHETVVTEIVLEVESFKEDAKEKAETKKRKRLQSGTLEDSTSKKSKPDTQYLLNSANIQNIDIESVLSKLHGP